MDATVTLYRPVGPEELELIAASDYRKFPSRLPGQTIFYPVVQEAYAVKIARDWNAKASGEGYVTRFAVRAAWLSRYVKHQAGGRDHQEYWIPAEDIEAFNDNIVGRIEVLHRFLGEEWFVVYDLASDQETIALVQRATLTTPNFGVVPEVALFGSDDWWAAIRDGRIPTHEVKGTISRLFLTGHRDWPEFELKSNGKLTTWSRLGTQSKYVEGKEVRVEYILQKLRCEPYQAQDKQVLRVLVRG